MTRWFGDLPVHGRSLLCRDGTALHCESVREAARHSLQGVGEESTEWCEYSRCICIADMQEHCASGLTLAIL